MKKSLLKSRTITELEEKIKLYGERAIEEFLCIIEETKNVKMFCLYLL